MVPDDRTTSITQQLLTGVAEQQTWPESDGDRTSQLSRVLKEVARKCGFTRDSGFTQYDKNAGGEWMNIDFWWWEKSEDREQAWLAAESQWWYRNETEILEDFQKLPSLKSHIKLMVFSSDEQAGERLKDDFDKYLSGFLQHTAGERYLVVRFDWNGQYACSWESTVSDSRKPSKLSPVSARSAAARQGS